MKNIIPLVIVAVLLAGCSSQNNPLFTLAPETIDPGRASVTMVLESGNFLNYDAAPTNQTFSGGNKSPQLNWSNTVSTVRSYVLIMYDVNAGDAIHLMWVNIPSATISLTEGQTTGGTRLTNSFGNLGYTGPKTTGHLYAFKVIGLSVTTVTLNTIPGYPSPTKAELLSVIKPLMVRESNALMFKF